MGEDLVTRERERGGEQLPKRKAPADLPGVANEVLGIQITVPWWDSVSLLHRPEQQLRRSW